MENMKKIAFVPGAFRPFGDHHMKMAKYYSDMCDEVVLVVSNPKNDENKRITSNNREISPEEAKSIIDLCLQDSGIKNITCQVSDDPNPIRTILRDISKLKDCSVVLGVSLKDDDQDRYDSIDQDYFKNNNVRIIPPNDTAFSPVKDDGKEISASDIRNHISDKEMLRSYLPVYIEDDTFNKIYDILNGKSKENLDSKEETRLGSQIFQNLLEDEKMLNESLDEEQEFQQYIDEEDTEFSGIRMNDSSLDNAKCSIIAYNTHITENDTETVYNPKTNPDKAIDILFEFDDGNKVEIFLDPNTKEWDSRVNDTAKLTPDQMGQFFGTDLCRKIDDRLFQIWPESDPYFKELLEAVKQKKINIDPCGLMTEDGEFRKGNIDINRSRGKNAAGEQIYTNSGRKIVSFSDFGVKHDDQEAYFVWPERGKEFKWSQWKDWEKPGRKWAVRCRRRL